MSKISEAARTMGSRKSKAKTLAARRNAKLAGRKRLFGKCPTPSPSRRDYHQFVRGKCVNCGLLKPAA
jgi:hypothetical protein